MPSPMYRLLAEIWTMLKATISSWINDNIPLHGAALAFYTIFSLAPLLIILIAVAGFLFGEQASQGQLAEYMEQVLGPEMASNIENIVLSAYQPRSGIIATVISAGIMLFAATTIITQLKDSLNTIWNVTTRKGQGLKRFLIDRSLALVLILIFAGVLIASILFNGVLSYLEPHIDPYLPGGAGIWSTLNDVGFVLITAGMFAVIYKMLPDIHIRWSDVWIGALVTTALFMLGRYLVGAYLGMGAIQSTYGAAGAFVVFLLWVYYNAMMVFLGAEFTRIYTERYGSQVKPMDHAIFLHTYTDEDMKEDSGGREPYL